MACNDEKSEKIYDLSPFVKWIEAPQSLPLALIADHPDLEPGCWRGFFSPGEWAEGQEKASPAAFRAWFLGRLAAKAAAGRLRAGRPEEMVVVKGLRGRPELAGGGRLSISHTRGAAAAAAAWSPLGLDLERLDRLLSERVRRWAFNAEESQLAAEAEESRDRGDALEAAARPEAAENWPGHLALWCAREAGAKAWGRGLLNHLEQVRVGAADWAAGRLRVDWRGPEPAARVRVDLIRSGDYLLALAAPAGPDHE